jgi:mannose-6-phosphate isomerase-like protein (cupin superfamily)
MSRRRVVTGHDAEGRSIIISDGPSPGRFATGNWEELWAFDSLPAVLGDTSDPAAVETFRLTPLSGQIACRLFTIRPPESEGDDEFETLMDYTETKVGDPDSDTWMHQTPTIDVIVVISGAVKLVLEGGEEVQLRQGDSVIQRGTMHGWRNSGAEPCVAVAFMVRAD